MSVTKEEGLQPGEEEGLQRGALNVIDLLIAGMSWMAPGFSLFFTIALVAGAAGTASPLAYLFAGVGVMCTAIVVSEFSRLCPSAGALQTFIARGFGRLASVVGGLFLSVGYLFLLGGVAVLFGGWTTALLDEHLSVSIPWQPVTVLGVALFTVLIVRGVNVSIRATWALFLTEFIILVVIAIAVLVQGGADGLSASPLNPLDIEGVQALALAMVFATFSFVGFEGAASFAEETPDPGRAVPIAVVGGVVTITSLYVLVSYAGVVGFGLPNVDEFAGDDEPIATLADSYVGPLVPLLQLAVLTSIAACLMAAGNANSRVVFNLGREGALASALGRIHPRYRTPYVANVVFMGLLLIPGLIGSMSWDYLTTFGNIAGFGALLAVISYMFATASLPAYVVRSGTRIRPVRHLVVPLFGAAVWLVPIWGTFKPGQAYPFNYFPLLAAAVLLLALSYTLYARHKGWVSRMGTSLADEKDTDPTTTQSPAATVTPGVEGAPAHPARPYPHGTGADQP